MGLFRRGSYLAAALLVVGALPWLGGCAGSGSRGGSVDTSNLSERDCLVRAMYFESNRSSYDGMMAVGTVVMNRVESDRFPSTVCGVVAQHRQFAPGVTTRAVDARQAGQALRAADAILAGQRYAPVGKAMHFHMASYKNPYPARYVAVAGGNAFYLKPGRRWKDEYTSSVQAASAAPDPSGPVRSLYQRAKAVASSGHPGEPCDTGTSMAAASMACESELEAR